ncbi:MAG TPA: SDR family NAD(P)-dependent oxidoreductase [Frankiaceae bacterium]|jgi:NAD(P)-dependent dehydrogenase (short-subunit alcohol dehydrogenase family)|nr:SDR family NAD(P)-dependent oxidoreductase [Frankiaceae bacterium]
MNVLAAGTGTDNIWGYGTDWLYLLVPLAIAAVVGAFAVRAGEAPANAQRGTRTLLRFGDGMGRWTGMPSYAAAGVTTLVTFLLVAALGFYWDVAWHVDYGRDDIIFTPGHTAIIVGVQGLLLSAAVTTLLATWTRADVALKGKHLRAPWGAVVMAALGIQAVTAFPLDELWHRAYGVDVTMWGPTHLGMISGASFGPLAALILIKESGARLTRFGRHLTMNIAGATLLGASTFQLEYDLGVPQWQHLYHPVLIALASGFALVLCRNVLGRGGAMYAALHYWIQRIVTILVVGVALNHTKPHWALYFGSAVLVEVAYAATRRRAAIVQALACGLAVTLGLGTELAWTRVFGRHPWGSALFPEIAVAALAAFAAAVLGTAAGRRLRGTRAGIPGWAVAVAGGLAVLTLVIPFPRRDDHEISATVRTTPATAGRTNVSVTVDKPTSIEGANWFEAFAWQGGSFEKHRMERVSTNEWVSAEPVPYGGSWKVLLRLANGTEMVAAPVYFPADAEIGAPEIPLVPERTVVMARDTRLLMREARAGDTTAALVAYVVLLASALLWLTMLVLGLRSRRLDRPDRLNGARVVVTGALGGIGVAVIGGLRSQGARVVGVDLVEGPDTVAANVTDTDATRAAVAEAAERLGGIDVLVNLAGIGRAHDAGDFPDADARRVVDVNLFGTWNATAAALPWLVASHGHVVVTASGLAAVNVPWAAAYAASKRGVAAYADTLRLEYDGRVSVTTVNPGYVRTPIHEVPAASGASLEGVTPPDSMDEVVRAYVTAIVERPRSIATSWRTTFGVWFAARYPALADNVVLSKMARLDRPAPTFVLSDERLEARREARRGASTRG